MPERRPDPSGRLLWASVTAAAVGLVAFATLGVTAAMVGVYSTWWILPVAALGTVAAAPIIRDAVPEHTHTHVAANVVMLAVAVGTLAYSAQHIGQHVVTRRDPGSYLTAGRWLADEPTLRVSVGDPVFDGIDDVTFGGPAVYPEGGTHAEFQFSHGSQTAMAAAYDLAGPRGLFASSAAIGALALLAIYLSLTTMTRQPWVAAAATTSFGISLPFVSATRNTYSEPFVLLVIALALGLMLGSGRSPRPSAVFVIGLLVGGSELFRVDARLYVVGILLVTGAWILRGLPVRIAALAPAGALVPVVVAAIDVRNFAGGYASDLGNELRLLDVATVVAFTAMVGAIILRRRGVVLPPRWRAHPTVAVSVAVVVLATGVAGWLVRPRLLPASAHWAIDSNYANAVVRLQNRHGLDPDPTRSYSELGIESVGWYLGTPMVAMALLGFSLISWRVVRDPLGRLAPAAIFLSVGVPLYLWDNRITPDHLWATRRFLPMVLPAFVLAAVWTADLLIRRIRIHRWRVAAIVIVAANFVIPAAVTTWPIRDLNDQRGNHGLVQDLCRRLGDDAIVIDLSEGLYAMTTRVWCGATAASIPYDSEAVGDVLRAGVRACRGTFVISRTDGRIEPWLERLEPVVLGVAANELQVNSTLDRAPSEYRSAQTVYRLAKATPGPECS